MLFPLYRIQYFPLGLMQQFLSLRLDFKRKRGMYVYQAGRGCCLGSQLSNLARRVEPTAHRLEL